MKNIVKKVLSFMMVLMLVMPMVPVSEVKADINSETTNMVIQDVAEGDKFIAYKIFNITINGSNQVEYDWATYEIGEAMKNAINSVTDGEQYDTVTVKDFYIDKEGNTRSDDKRKQILSHFLFHVENGLETCQVGTENVQAVEVGDTGKYNATWENVGLGGYFIMPTQSTMVYQTILTVVQPDIDENGNYEIAERDVEVTLKRNPVTITKKAYDRNDSEVTTIGREKYVKFVIEADLPKYDTDELNFDPLFFIEDNLPTGMKFTKVNNSDKIMQIYGIKPGGDVVEILWANLLETDEENNVTYESTLEDENGTKYNIVETFLGDQSGFGIELDGWRRVENDPIAFENILLEKIRIVYYASVEDDVTPGPLTNTATMHYSYYPYEDGKEAQANAECTVNTYGININKYDTTNTGKKLDGAKFELYYKIESSEDSLIYYDSKQNCNSEIPGLLDVDKNSEFIKIEEPIITANGGMYNVKGLDTGVYYLKEIAPPNGYTILDRAVRIEITDDMKNGENTIYIATADIPNSRGFQLPETGGTGTVIFTVVGVSLMCVAVLAFFILRKKEMSKN